MCSSDDTLKLSIKTKLVLLVVVWQLHVWNVSNLTSYCCALRYTTCTLLCYKPCEFCDSLTMSHSNEAVQIHLLTNDKKMSSYATRQKTTTRLSCTAKGLFELLITSGLFVKWPPFNMLNFCKCAMWTQQYIKKQDCNTMIMTITEWYKCHWMHEIKSYFFNNYRRLS